jgi:DNA-binding transcriptional ArsR family regulator
MFDNNARETEEELCKVRIIHWNRIVEAREKDIPRSELGRLAAIYKILGDPTRLRIVSALSQGEMCVCDLAAYTGLSESAISHHMRRLKDLFLVRNRREGQVLYYALDDDHVAQLLEIGLAHIRESG